MVIFSSFFSRVMFLMSAQIVHLKWCKVAKIAFPRYLSRVISSLNTYVLLKTMINQIGFICAKFLRIRFANVTQFDRPKEMHCTTVIGYCTYIQNQAALFISRKDALYQVFLYLCQINAMCHKSVEITLINILLLITSFIIPFIVFIWNIPSFWMMVVLKIHVESKSYFTLQRVILHQ